MLVSSRHLTPKLWFVGNAGGTRASSPQGSQCSQYTVLGVHGASMPAEGLCLPHLHPLPSAPGSLEVSGCLLPSPKPPFPSHQPQVFFLKMILVALPSIFVSWPRPLHPPSLLSAWAGLLRGFPLSQWSPPSLPTRINLSKKKKRTVKAISGRARAGGFPSAALGARSGENFQLQRETHLATAESWEEKADCNGQGRGIMAPGRDAGNPACVSGVKQLGLGFDGFDERSSKRRDGAKMSLFQGDVRCTLLLTGDAMLWGTSLHGHRCTGIAARRLC